MYFEEYAPGTAMRPRLRTDALFMLPAGSYQFNGYLKDAVEGVQTSQCLDASLWRLFVNQFRRGDVDDADAGWRCEYWGKMLRGACFVYRVTRSAELYKTLEDTVRDMLSLKNPSGRVSTYTPEGEFRGWDIWGRKYILLGLQYFLEICPDAELGREILDFMVPFTDYIIEHIGEGRREINETGYPQWGGMNSSSLLEPIVRMYSLTGEARYLEFADYIVSRGGCSKGNLFELAYEGRLYPYEYPVIKAYEMMSCFEGLLEYYRVTGVYKWRVAAENFARLVAKSDITIIGCAGCTHELFDHSAVRQLDASEKGIIQETCVTVTWMKLCNQLLCLTGDSFFADEIEKSVYNALMGAVNTNKRKPGIKLPQDTPSGFLPEGLPFDSYSPILPGYRGRGVGGYKVMENGTYYGCCACIGGAGMGMIGMAAAHMAKKGLALNLFLNGTLTGAGFELDIKTAYPVSGSVKITVKAAPDAPLYIRIPYWSRNTAVRLNGEPVSRVVPGNYLELYNKWNPGDVIEIELDMTVRPVYPEDYGVSSETAGCVAFRRGALLLCRSTETGDDVDAALSYRLDESGCAEFMMDDTPGINCVISGRLALEGGGRVRVIDYASAGKNWMEDKIAAWMPGRAVR